MEETARQTKILKLKRKALHRLSLIVKLLREQEVLEKALCNGSF